MTFIIKLKESMNRKTFTSRKSFSVHTLYSIVRIVYLFANKYTISNTY